MPDFNELVKNLYTSKDRELTQEKLDYINKTYMGKEEDFVKNFYATVGEELPQEKLDYISSTYLKKKDFSAPTTPTFSTNVEDYTKPSQNGVEITAPSPLSSNLKSGIPTRIDPYNTPKTKDVVDINAEVKPFDSNILRAERKQRMGGHSANIMSAIEKDPELYTNKASKSHWGTQSVPEVPNIDNISKAVDFYAEKAKKTTGEEITPYDKQYLVNSLAEQIKARKNIAEKVALTNLDTTKEMGMPLTAFTGVKDEKGNVITKGSFQDAEEKIIKGQDKEIETYKNNIANLNKKVAAEVTPEVNALKEEVGLKANLLNKGLKDTFDKAFQEKDKALYDHYTQLVQSGQMPAAQANQEMQVQREQLHKQTQSEVSSAFAPKFDELNKEANLKSKDIQSRYNRNYLAQAKAQKGITDKKLKAIAEEHAVDMPKGYMDAYAKNFEKNSKLIDKQAADKAYFEAKNTPIQARMAKAMTAGFGDVLGSIGGAMSFAGLDASSLNDVVLKTAVQNELPSTYFQDKSIGEKLTDPQWWIDNGVRSVPFMLATMPMGIAAGGGTGTLARMLGASKKAATVASVVGGGAVSWAGEATLEAGSAFNDALKQGYSEKDASEIAAKTFQNNLVTLPLSVFQMMPVFNKAFKFTKALAVETVSGGLEEILQGWSQAQANAAAQGQDVSMFEYAKTPQAMEEGAIGAAMSSGMAMFALDHTENIDKQIATLMSSVSVGGEQHARAVLDVMNKNQAITDLEYKQANLQLDYIMDGISKVQNFNIDDSFKAGLIGKFAKIGRAKAMLTDDENDLASQAAKEMIAEQEKEIKEILKGTAPLYLVFERGNPIPTTTSKEEFVAILKDPKLREQFTLQAINDDKWQAQIDKVYKTEKPSVSGGTSASEGTTITDKNQETRAEGDFANDNEFYRVVVGDEAFNDIVESGVVRVKESQEKLDKREQAKNEGGINLDRSGTTAYPSFSKGSASMSYAKENPNNYIIVTDDKSIQPSKVGRHGKGTTMFPTNEEGNHQTELSGDKIKGYKHIGNGQYQLVYDKGVVLNNTQEQNIETPKETTPTTTPSSNNSSTIPTPNNVKEETNVSIEPTQVENVSKKDEKIDTKTEVAPKEGDTATIEVPNRMPKKMVFKDGKWQQKVGNEFSEVGKADQAEAQAKFNETNLTEKAPIGETTEKPTAKETPPSESPVFSDKNMTKEEKNTVDNNVIVTQKSKFGLANEWETKDGVIKVKHTNTNTENIPEVFTVYKDGKEVLVTPDYDKALNYTSEYILGGSQKTAVQETGTEKKVEQPLSQKSPKFATEKATKALNTTEVEAVAKVLAAEAKKENRNEVAEETIKETANAETILAITKNIDDIRKKLLASENIQAIDCSWVK